LHFGQDEVGGKAFAAEDEGGEVGIGLRMLEGQAGLRGLGRQRSGLGRTGRRLPERLGLGQFRPGAFEFLRGRKGGPMAPLKVRRDRALQRDGPGLRMKGVEPLDTKRAVGELPGRVVARRAACQPLAPRIEGAESYFLRSLAICSKNSSKSGVAMVGLAPLGPPYLCSSKSGVAIVGLYQPTRPPPQLQGGWGMRDLKTGWHRSPRRRRGAPIGREYPGRH
jgi:hypothetical protein